MPLSLKDTQALIARSDHLYGFLPALTHLLEATLEQRRSPAQARIRPLSSFREHASTTSLAGSRHGRAATSSGLGLECLTLHVHEDRQEAGLMLDHDVYLLEAKWTKEPVDQKERYAFRVSMEGKSSYPRGLFISVSGFTGAGQEAISQGKTPNFMVADGAHLFRVEQTGLKCPVRAVQAGDRPRGRGPGQSRAHRSQGAYRTVARLQRAPF